MLNRKRCAVASHGGNALLAWVPDKLSQNKFFAFTLAEVLITLGIIGVVAALTIPTLVTNYQKKVTVAKLKQGYAILKNAIQLSTVDNGDLDEWDYENLTDEEFVNTYIIPYLQPVQNVGKRQVWALGSGESHAKYMSHFGAGNGEVDFYAMPNGIEFAVTLPNYWAFASALLAIDINGQQSPNEAGNDVFLMAISKGFDPYRFDFYNINMVSAYKDKDTSREALLNPSYKPSGLHNGCVKDEESVYAGHSCGYLIMQDGWEIRDDYPW